MSFDYLEDGWFSSGDELEQCRQRLIHVIDARLHSADVLPFVVQLPQEFVDEHAKVCASYTGGYQLGVSVPFGNMGPKSWCKTCSVSKRIG